MLETTIVRSDDLRNENRRRVLSALRSAGPGSPAKLAKITGLSAASISSLSNQLVEQGIVQSTRPKLPGGASRGRPQTLIDLNGGAGDVVTLSLTIDLIKVLRVNYAGKLQCSEVIEINTRLISESDLLKHCCAAIEKMMSFSSEQKVHRIGVAVQGVTENASGALTWSPIIKHQNVDLPTLLRGTFDLPISVNNDCRLISEALSRNFQDTLGKSFATVLFSHGVGLGLYIDGKPFSGIRTSALELGHLRFERDGALCRCGRRGCIEAYAADYGIERLASGVSIHDEPAGRVKAHQMQSLCDAALANDTPAIQAFAIAGAALGEGLAAIFTLLDPMPVALVGRDKEAFELMRTGVHSVFRNAVSRNSMNPSLLIDDLIHCFEDDDPLLQCGLIHNTLVKLDTQFAYGMFSPASARR